MDDFPGIRQATLEDVPTVVRHRRLMFESMGHTDAGLNDVMDARTSEVLGEAIPTGAYRGWLVEDAGAVVAGAGLSIVRLPGKPWNPEGTFTYLMSLYVEPAYRRRGIARRLMETMVEWTRGQGIAEARLHASLEGRSLYEELGFEQTNEMRLPVA